MMMIIWPVDTCNSFGWNVLADNKRNSTNYILMIVLWCSYRYYYYRCTN